MRASLACLAGAACVALFLGCGIGGGREPRLDSRTAASLAESLRTVLADRFKPPVEVRYGTFAGPADGDSIPGYVVKISTPFELLERDTIPHEWLRARFASSGWTLEAQADGPDGSSYRALSGPAAITVEAAWESLHEPVDVADWYWLTLGIPSQAPARAPAR